MLEELRGWQPDPYGLHELRYFTADGKPSRLVRDGETWSKENPPDDFYSMASSVVPPPAEASQHRPPGAQPTVSAAQSPFVDPAPRAWEQSDDPAEQRAIHTQEGRPRPTPSPRAWWEARYGVAPTDDSDIPSTAIPAVLAESRPAGLHRRVRSHLPTRKGGPGLSRRLHWSSSSSL
jgi:hypothetical protein